MSTRSELMVLTTGRPAVVTYEGCRIYISAHDEGYQRTKAEYKQRLKLAHPDMQTRPMGDVVGFVRGTYTQRSRSGNVYTVRAHAVKGTRRKLPPPRSAEFRRLRKKYEAWLLSERAWYAQYDLEPPDWGTLDRQTA